MLCTNILPVATMQKKGMTIQKPFGMMYNNTVFLQSEWFTKCSPLHSEVDTRKYNTVLENVIVLTMKASRTESPDFPLMC